MGITVAIFQIKSREWGLKFKLKLSALTPEGMFLTVHFTLLPIMGSKCFGTLEVSVLPASGYPPGADPSA